MQSQIFKPFLRLLLRERSLVVVILLEMLTVYMILLTSYYILVKMLGCGKFRMWIRVHILLIWYVLCGFTGADTFSGNGNGSTDEPQSGGWLHKFTVGAYKPFFDVDTSDVVERLKESLFPFRGTFTEKTADKPDL